MDLYAFDAKEYIFAVEAFGSVDRQAVVAARKRDFCRRVRFHKDGFDVAFFYLGGAFFNYPVRAPLDEHAAASADKNRVHSWLWHRNHSLISKVC